jgi:hypothetical protein
MGPHGYKAELDLMLVRLLKAENPPVDHRDV